MFRRDPNHHGGPSVVGSYWDDIDLFIIAGCSVLDVNDYNNNFSGADHTASPGEQWETTGPSVFLGYNAAAPQDNQNSDTIIASWASNRGTSGDIEAWKDANNNSNGRNACAIETGANYYYFKKIAPLWYVWTTVPKADW